MPLTGRSFAAWWPLALLAALAVAGAVVHALDLIDWRALLALARGYATQGWLAPALIALQVLMFTFGLPGSAVLWLAAVLFPPAQATAILTGGGCAGALAAYAFARRLSAASRARLQATRSFRLLQRHGDFLMLCALRLAPGFPHSVLNYGAGILHLPLPSFLAAAALGFGVKSALYSSAIHRALAAEQPADLLAPDVLWPLAAAVPVLLVAHAVRRSRSRADPPR